jgi:integrase
MEQSVLLARQLTHGRSCVQSNRALGMITGYQPRRTGLDDGLAQIGLAPGDGDFPPGVDVAALHRYAAVAAELEARAKSAATRIAYHSDMKAFGTFAGQVGWPTASAPIGVPNRAGAIVERTVEVPDPITPALIHAYLGYLVEAGYSVATLERRYAAIRWWFAIHDRPFIDHPRVRRALEGNAKRLRADPRLAPRPKKAIDRELLIALVDATAARATLRAARDRALLLVLFATGMRRSEAAALEVSDVAFSAGDDPLQGITLRVRSSKTDQTGAGRSVGVQRVGGPYCPVAALQTWLARAALVDGPIFRSMTRHDTLRTRAISGDDVPRILREYLDPALRTRARLYVDELGILDHAEREAAISAYIARENVVLEPDPQGRLRARRLRAYAGHSFRRGHVTASQRAGLALEEIGANTGQSVATVARYVENRAALARAVTRKIIPASAR